MKRRKIGINDTVFDLYGIAKRLRSLAHLIAREVSDDPGEDRDPTIPEGVGLMVGDLARTLQVLAVTVDEYVAKKEQEHEN